MKTVTLLVQASLIFIHPTTGKKVQVGASAKPQTAPDWIMDTPTYKFAAKSGLVYAINYVTPPVEQNTKPVPAEVAIGFNHVEKPSIDSLVKSGMGLQEASDAISGMEKQQTVLEEVIDPVVSKEMYSKPSNLKMG